MLHCEIVPHGRGKSHMKVYICERHVEGNHEKITWWIATNTLMNGHWEELIGKVEELLHATDDPDNYRMHIQYIIQFSSDGLQRLKSFLRLHVRRCVQAVIECEWLCINPCWPPNRAWWIYRWINPRPIVNRVFNQVLRDHPDLRHAVNAQVSILCQSFKWFVLKNGDHG